MILLMSDREFIEGTDVSMNPRELLNRGIEQLQELEQAIQRWAAAARPRLEQSVDAELTWVRTTVRIDQEAPTRRWSLLLGEAVHSFREALDALAWDLAHVDGKTPAKETRVYFPIVSTGRDWRSAQGGLDSVPPAARARILSIQPIAIGADLRTNVLWAINKFDVDKKHRGQLIAGKIDWAPGDLGRGEWELDSPDGFRPELGPDPLLEDGSLLLTVWFTPPAKKVHGPNTAPLAFTFVAGEGAETMDLGSLIDALPTAMNHYFDVVLKGPPSV